MDLKVANWDPVERSEVVVVDALDVLIPSKSKHAQHTSKKSGAKVVGETIQG